MATEPEVTEQEQTNQPEVDPETGKFIFTYQPRDAEGKFIPDRAGKAYKFLYTDHQDLVQQLARAKEEGDRYIHELKTGKRQLKGEPAVPAPSYEPAPEPTEEAEKKRREEARKLMEEELGAPVDVVRKDIKEAREIREYVIAQNWAMNNPAYYACKENAVKLNGYLQENKLALTPANLDLAFEELRDSLAKAPELIEAPANSTQQQTEVTATPEKKPQSTGIISSRFAGTRQSNRIEKLPLTAERFRQISKMSYPQFTQLKRVNPNEYWDYVRMKEAKAQPQQ